MMSSKGRIKRYEADPIDFIIPFLIHQSMERTVKPEVKRNSIPYFSKDTQDQEIDKIAKIYNIKPKRSLKKQLLISKSNYKDQERSALDQK